MAFQKLLNGHETVIIHCSGNGPEYLIVSIGASMLRLQQGGGRNRGSINYRHTACTNFISIEPKCLYSLRWLRLLDMTQLQLPYKMGLKVNGICAILDREVSSTGEIINDLLLSKRAPKLFEQLLDLMTKADILQCQSRNIVLE